MITRRHFHFVVLFACVVASLASALSQTTRNKPRVFVSDQPIRAGRHLDQKPTEPIDAKRAKAITDTCPAVVVTTAPDDADYFLLWWRGLRDAFALYDRNGHFIVRGSTAGPRRGEDVAQTLCKFVERMEKSHSQRATLSSRKYRMSPASRTGASGGSIVEARAGIGSLGLVK